MPVYYLAIVKSSSQPKAASSDDSDVPQDDDAVSSFPQPSFADSAAPEDVILCHAQNLSSLSFYQRPSVSEFLGFFAKTVAARTAPGQRQSVMENQHIAHVYNPGDPEQLIAVAITDQEYPVRPAFNILTQLLHSFQDPQFSLKDKSLQNEFEDILQNSQDPVNMDTIMRVQQELDETKIILHKTIDSVLQRGEKISDLVDRSTTLSAQSKMFYKTAKKQNSCCIIM